MVKRRIIVSTIFSLVFLIIGIIALPNYGVNWDEPVHFGRGQAILHFLLTGEKDYKSFEKKSPVRRSLYQNESYSYAYFEKTFRSKSDFIIGAGHPVISDVLASITNRIVFGWLGLLGDIESYHLYSIILSALLVGAVVYFTSSFYGLFAGFVAGLSLLLYPLFLGESIFNIKDPPEAVYYAFTAMTFFLGIIRSNWRWIAVSSVFAGLAFGTKLNIVFLFLSFGLWLFVYWGSLIKKTSLKKFIKSHKKIILSLGLFPIVTILLYFASWPILWEDPLSRFLYNLSYYKTIGLGAPLDSRFSLFGVNTYAPQWIFFTTPPIVLVLSVIGIFWVIRFGFGEKYKTGLFVFLWFLVPIARVMFPGAGIYGGVRQIMEYVPAMAILSGVGASYLVQGLKLTQGVILRRSRRIPWDPSLTLRMTFRSLLTFNFELLILLLFISIIFKLISLYPNESIYFNEFIGGLKGAAAQNIPGWGNSLGSTYRQGVNWINENAEKDSKLALVYELRSNIALSDLRPDINFINQNRSTHELEGEYIIGVTHEGTGEERFHRRYLERFLNPVHEVKVDGVSVLKVWKNDFEHRKPLYRKKERKIENFSITKGPNTLTIDLKRAVPLTRVYIYYSPNNCMLPSTGYFELSLNGNIWKRETGDFSTGTRVRLSEEGVLRYFFAGERTRFVQAVVGDEGLCSLNSPNAIEIYHI